MFETYCIQQGMKHYILYFMCSNIVRIYCSAHASGTTNGLPAVSLYIDKFLMIHHRKSNKVCFTLVTVKWYSNCHMLMNAWYARLRDV